MSFRYLSVLTVSALMSISGAWHVALGDRIVERFSDTEAGFADPSFQPHGEPLAPSETTPAPETSPATSAPETALRGYLPPIPEPTLNGRTRWNAYWVPMNAQEISVYGTLERTSGPSRVGLQAGHWKLDEVPEELVGLRASSGARGGGYTEQEAVLRIAQIAKDMLENEGVIVDLLPATVPVDYVADAFVSIHADGSTSPNISGYKLAAPSRDFSGRSEDLVEALYASYGEVTGMKRDSSITRRMTGYYAFNWRRYDHAIHPMVPAAIVETGFMTSAADRAIIVAQPELAAEGIVAGILAFLDSEGLR